MSINGQMIWDPFLLYVCSYLGPKYNVEVLLSENTIKNTMVNYCLDVNLEVNGHFLAMRGPCGVMRSAP